MTENDIRGLCAALENVAGRQRPATDDDDKTVASAAVQLLQIALVDLHRIADAVERLAAKPSGAR